LILSQYQLLLCAYQYGKAFSVMKTLKRVLFSGFFCVLAAIVHAQVDTSIVIHPIMDSSAKLRVDDIIIKGNKKTKTYIILREMLFKAGDSISVKDLAITLEKTRQLVYNTTLFNEVKIEAVQKNADHILVIVSVKERWYIYPLPQFQLVDRSFNEWVKTYHASLDRVVYGGKFTHYNLSGRRDQLRVYLLTGYSRNIAFSYTAPYSNSKLTEGFTIGAGFTQNREIAYKTSFGNKILFYPADSIRKKTNDFVRSNWYINAGYTLRRGYYQKHFFTFLYNHYKVEDSIITKYNPHYFNTNKTAIGVPEFSYTYQYVNVNNVSYPLTGIGGYATIIKRGLGFKGNINMLQLEAGITKFFNLGSNWYSSTNFNAKIKLPFEQAYINQRGLGYGDIYLRGLEYYVVDGVATALLRQTFKKKLFSFNVPFPFKSKTIPKIPFTFFAKTFGDLGYAYNKKPYEFMLNNKLLYTGGFGIDILTLYDINLRIEYSFNQLGENGLFLHTQGGF
jgi:outer membrane protein assembly factor BamA